MPEFMSAAFLSALLAIVLIDLVLAGGALATGIAVLKVGAGLVLAPARPAPPRAIDKVPIKL